MLTLGHVYPPPPLANGELRILSNIPLGITKNLDLVNSIQVLDRINIPRYRRQLELGL